MPIWMRTEGRSSIPKKCNIHPVCGQSWQGQFCLKTGSISVLDSIRQTIEESAGGDPGIFYTFWADKNGEDTVIFCYYARGFDYTLYLLL